MAEKKQKKFKRIRRRKGAKVSLYFNKGTQDAIIKYQNSDSHGEKEKLYENDILPAFDKLVENLIFIYRFISPVDPYEILKNDCIAFLYETLHKWNPERGTKAFSYFNVVGKNWLIINARQSKKRSMKHVSLSDMQSLSRKDAYEVAAYDIIPSPDDILINRNFRNEIMQVLLEIQSRVHGESEKSCINAVIKVFETIDELDFLNKRAVFVYVREISGLNPKQLSVAMSTIRKHYRELVHKTKQFDIF